MEVVLTKKIKAFEQSQEMKDVKILQKLEEEITNQIKKESESKNIDVEDVKKQEFDVKSVNECLNKIDLDTKNKPSEGFFLILFIFYSLYKFHNFKMTS